MRRCVFVFLGLLFLCCGLRARAQAFDLTGPKVDVHVKRGDVTLPIGQVPRGCQVIEGAFWRGPIARHDRWRP